MYSSTYQTSDLAPRLHRHWLLRDCRNQRRYARDYSTARGSVMVHSGPSPHYVLRQCQRELADLRTQARTLATALNTAADACEVGL